VKHPLLSFSALGAIAFCSTPALAYVGPGLGLTAIGSALALVAAALLAIVGFVWYPLKRLIGRGKAKEEIDGDLDPAERTEKR